MDSDNQRIYWYFSYPDYRMSLSPLVNSTVPISPMAYVNQLRIQQAKLLHEKHQLDESEVAYACGFKSLAYFSKSFKKHYGISPSS
jgi:AraC-like DNA-binding protein